MGQDTAVVGLLLASRTGSVNELDRLHPDREMVVALSGLSTTSVQIYIYGVRPIFNDQDEI